MSPQKLKKKKKKNVPTRKAIIKGNITKSLGLKNSIEGLPIDIQNYIDQRLKDNVTVRHLAEELTDRFPETKGLPSRDTINRYRMIHWDRLTDNVQEKQFESEKIKLKGEALKLLKRHIFHTSIIQQEIDKSIEDMFKEGANDSDILTALKRIMPLKRETREDLRVIAYVFTHFNIKITYEEEDEASLEQLDDRKEDLDARVSKIVSRYGKRLTLKKKVKVTRTS